MSLLAAIYSRISDDREGTEVGVDRQEEDCQKLAQQHGFEVVEVFRENDRSASTRSRKPRPLYAEMLAGARSGQFSVILAYSNSRLTRRPMEVEDLIQLNERHGTRIYTVVSGNDDLSTADGRMVARIKGNVDAAEAERTAERVKRAKVQNALNGQYRGGPRPFGFEPDGMTVRESEAAVIREATKAVLAGRTLAAVARELRERGVTGTRGKPITYNNLRDMLLRPRNAGILAHGLPNRSSSSNNSTRPYEEVGPAAWPAIVPEEEWRALVALLTDSDRLTAPVTEKRWIGSGIYRCGVPVVGEDGIVRPCGGLLRVAPHGGTARRPFERRYLYRCTTSAHLTISQSETDDYIRALVAERVRDPKVIAALHPGNADLSSDRERRTLLARRLSDFEADYAAGRIKGAQLQKATQTVEAEIAEIDARLAQGMTRSTTSAILRAPDPGQAFLDGQLDIQRAVLAAVVTVEVLPAPVRGGSWTKNRLRITPVGAEEARS